MRRRSRLSRYTAKRPITKHTMRQAQADADRLEKVFSSKRGELSPELTSSCEAMIDRITAAQLQLMAFAINRKNRGLPDSAQAEAELADRKAFQDGAQTLLERLKSPLSRADVNSSNVE